MRLTNVLMIAGLLIFSLPSFSRNKEAIMCGLAESSSPWFVIATRDGGFNFNGRSGKSWIYFDGDFRSNVMAKTDSRGIITLSNLPEDQNSPSFDPEYVSGSIEITPLSNGEFKANYFQSRDGVRVLRSNLRCSIRDNEIL